MNGEKEALAASGLQTTRTDWLAAWTPSMPEVIQVCKQITDQDGEVAFIVVGPKNQFEHELGYLIVGKKKTLLATVTES